MLYEVITSKGTMPVVLLKEGGTETKGRDAQKNNIAAAKIIAEIVHSSLGPRGMDKMLVDSLGDVTITNDGATILKEIDVQHPAAKMMVEISKTVDNEVGDGTTSSVIFGGALLARAEDLRITSYNVCYTKLLRDAVLLWGEQEFESSIQVGDEVPSDPIETTVNGKKFTFTSGHDKTLLRLLREEGELIGTKEG